MLKCFLLEESEIRVGILELRFEVVEPQQKTLATVPGKKEPLRQAQGGTSRGGHDRQAIILSSKTIATHTKAIVLEQTYVFIARKLPRMCKLIF